MVDPRTTQSNVDLMPYSRSRMSRESSELRFHAGKRQVTDSAKKKRILGDRQGFCHSQLSSAFGRESQVLKNIYKRVKNFEKKEDDERKELVNQQQKVVEKIEEAKKA